MFVFDDVIKSFALGIISGIGAKVAGLIFDKIFPPDVPSYFDDVYQEITKIVDQALIQDDIDKCNGQINAVVTFMRTNYPTLKAAKGETGQELYDVLMQQEQKILDPIGLLTLEKYAKAGVSVFMIACLTHITICQEIALVDPKTQKPIDSSYAKITRDYAQQYSTFLRKTVDEVVQSRLSKIVPKNDETSAWYDDQYTGKKGEVFNLFKLDGTMDPLFRAARDNAMNEYAQSTRTALLATLADPYGLAQKMDSLWMDYPLPTPWVGYLSAPQIVVDGVLFDMDWYADVNNLRGSKAMTDYQIPAPTNPFDLSDPTTLKLMSAAVLQQTYSGVTKPGDFLKTYLFTTDDYVSRGFQAGLQTSPVFDWKFYLSSNTDLAAQCGESRGKLYDHFANNGINASRVSSHIFDGKFYRDKYADLNKLFNDNWHDYSKHFITSGIKEGRQASAEFDPKYYRSKYGDLNTLFGDDWRKYYLHYVEYGVSEGRVGSADRAGAPKSR